MNAVAPTKRTNFLQRMIANTSTILRRNDLASMAGKTFSGDRDLYRHLGYKRNLTFFDFYERYMRGGIAARVVTALPNATWRAAPAIMEVGNEEETAFTKAWVELETRLKAFHYLKRLDRIAGVGRYGTMLIGTVGGKLDQPKQPVSGPDDVLYLAIYSEGNSEHGQLNDNPGSARFGLPEMYSVALSNSLPTSNIAPLRQTAKVLRNPVHHSHIIHFADELTEDDLYGIPRMQQVWNYLDDLEKMTGGAAEGIWQTVVPITQFNVDPEMELNPEDETAFADEIEELYHGLRRYIRTKGIEAKQLTQEVADPTGAVQAVVGLISGSTGIPQRILLGSERGELSSEQDTRSFDARIRERQTTVAETHILRPFIDSLINIKALPEPSKGYRVIWPDPSTMTLKEEADVAARVGQSLVHFATAIEKGTCPLTYDEFRKEYLGLNSKNFKPEERPKPQAIPLNPNKPAIAPGAK